MPHEFIPSKRNGREASDGKRCGLCLLLFLVSMAATGKAFGDAALLIEEPYGLFGSINPTGHSAIYLNRVCAETPTMLRRCNPGETGVVISRYSRIRKLDWVAIPLLPYLYAVEKAEDVPEQADRATVEKLQNEYAEAHLGHWSPWPRERDTTRRPYGRNCWAWHTFVRFTASESSRPKNRTIA